MSNGTQRARVLRTQREEVYSQLQEQLRTMGAAATAVDERWDLAKLLRELQHERDLEWTRRVQLFRNITYLLRQALETKEEG